MKKAKSILLIIIILSFSINLIAQKDRKLSNGFSINLITGIPSKTYATPSDMLPEDFGFKAIYGLQLGNRWYYKPNDRYGVGLMVNWLDITFAAKVDASYALDISLIEFGPLYTKVLNENVAIDAYYNLRPTFFGRGDKITNDDLLVYRGFNFMHSFGLAYRWKTLNVGIEYLTGSVNGKEGSLKGSSTMLTGEDKKLSANSFQILLGVKF